MHHYILLLTGLLVACSPDAPPTSPAGKASQGILGALTPFEGSGGNNNEVAQDETSTAADSLAAIEDSLAALPDSIAFNVELVFLDEFDPFEMEIMLREVKHWEKMLSDLPDYRIGYSRLLSDCGDHPIRLERGRIIDDVLMYVSKLPTGTEDGVAGLGGVWEERGSADELPIVGCVMMGEWKSGPKGTPYHEAFIQDVFLHEMGHALGIGSGYNWNKFLVWEEDEAGFSHVHFAGPSAIAAYDALPRLVRPDPDSELGPLGGLSMPLLEQPGGILYTGKKVPLLDGAHWGETIGGELVAYDPVVEIDRWPKLSTITLGALEDMGYPVRYENADLFWVELDEVAGKPTVAWRCGVQSTETR